MKNVLQFIRAKKKVKAHPESMVFSWGLAVARFLAFFKTELAVSSSSSAVTFDTIEFNILHLNTDNV